MKAIAVELIRLYTSVKRSKQSTVLTVFTVFSGTINNTGEYKSYVPFRERNNVSVSFSCFQCFRKHKGKGIKTGVILLLGEKKRSYVSKRFLNH